MKYLWIHQCMQYKGTDLNLLSVHSPQVLLQASFLTQGYLLHCSKSYATNWHQYSLSTQSSFFVLVTSSGVIFINKVDDLNWFYIIVMFIGECCQTKDWNCNF